MPFQPIDFTRAPTIDSGVGDIFTNLLKGYKGSQLPRELALEQQKAKLSNEKAGIENAFLPREKESKLLTEKLLQFIQEKKNEFAPEKMRADIDLTKADTKSKEFKNQLGLGNVSGPVAQELAVRNLEKIGHPDAEAARSTLEWYKQQEQLKRNQSPAQRNLAALDSINQGVNPNTGQKFQNKDEQKHWSRVLDKELLNQITNPEEKKRVINLTNMEDTLDSIDVRALTDFNGVKQFEKLKEMGKDLSGELSQRYANHKKALKKLEVLKSQYRNGFGEAASQGSMRHIDDLLKPNKFQSQELATQVFNELRNLLKREGKTLKKGILDTSVYYSPDVQNPYGIQGQNQGASNIDDPLGIL